jgi:predicted NAD/FAD-dependent oxidoreductase
MAVIGDEDLHDADAALQRFVGTPRMTAPARFLADSLPVTLQCTVDNIEKTATGWQIDSREQGRLAGSFDTVILAVPAPRRFRWPTRWHPAWRPLPGGQRCAAAGP